MPARRPTRPAPGTALVMPAVEDDATQRAFDQVELVIAQLQARISRLEAIVEALP